MKKDSNLEQIKALEEKIDRLQLCIRLEKLTSHIDFIDRV